MADEKKVLSSLLEAILQMELPKEVYAGFAREMMTRAGLSLDDCFPADQTALFLKNVRNKCDELFRLTESSPFSAAAAEILPSASEKTETEKMPLEDENGIVGYVLGAGEKKGGASAAEETPLPVPRKGYSRNGKKRGRPCKRKTVENENPAVSEQTKTEEESELPVPAEPSAETKTGPQEAARTESERPLSSAGEAAVDEDGFTAAEREEIEKLKMGKEYSMDILYRWRDRMVVSDRVLQEGTPLGVFVPYNRKALEYEKFVLYFCDEISGLPLNKAEAYARSKLPAYKGEKWKVLDSWQIEAAGQAQPELNRILKKIGGDPFAGSYLTPKTVHYHKMPDKIRYAVNVR
mgnify:FL=1